MLSQTAPACSIFPQIMKRSFKSIIVLLITGFLAFAPPGTLIFISLLIIGFTGKAGFIIVCVVALIALCVWFYRKKMNKARL